MSEKPVTELTHNEYVGSLLEHFKVLYKDLEHKFREIEEKAEGSAGGSNSGLIRVGDHVLVKREPSSKCDGALRFQERTWPDIYRVVKGDHPSFHLRGRTGRPTPFTNPQHARNLIKLDMPELRLDPDQPRLLELLPAGADPDAGWVKYRVDKSAIDGQVLLRKVDDLLSVERFNLSTQQYRWLL